MPDRFERVARLTGWRGLLVGAIVGALIGLGQAPLGLFWIAIPGLIASVLLFQRSKNAVAGFRRGWAIGAGYALVTMSWIVEPFLVDIAAHGWMAPFALGFMAAGFGLFWGAAFALARWLGNGSFGLVITWTGAEVLRSYLFTGFPWALISYIWTETPVLQFSAYVGPHGMTFFTLFTCALAVGLWRKWVAMAALAAYCFAIYGIGGIIENLTVEDGTDDQTIVRMIQPNADQHEKWDPEMIPVFYNRQLTLTAEESDPSPDLIIWPEVAVPFLLDDFDAPLWEISGAADSVPVIIGAQRYEAGKFYNSIGVIDEFGEIAARYDKSHLVPFGEYLPLAELAERFGITALASQFSTGFSAGPGAVVLDLGALGKVLPLICYEAIFPHEVRAASIRPDWLLVVTNDAWFGKVSGPHQHLAQARARSVELGLPMVRVANTGITAMIDARGRIVAALPMGVAGRLDVALPPPLSPTVYAKLGDWPLLVWLCLAFGASLVRKFRLTAS